MGSRPAAICQLEFYEDPTGEGPVRYWLAQDLTGTRRLALG